MHTKNGKPLQVYDNTVYSRTGRVVGRINGNKVLSPTGRYVGTIDGARLVFRVTDSAVLGSPFVVGPRAGIAAANAAGAAIWGDEPDIPD